jgi:hypothetical protein
MRQFFLLAPVALLMILFQTSCSMGGNDDGTNPSQGSFLIANVSPDAPALNVYINNSLFNQGFGYRVYTPYYGAVAGSYTFTFTDANNATVLSNSINIEANKAYSYILIDSFKKIKSTFIEDKLIVPGADSVYIRFFNFSPNSQPLNLRDSVKGTVLYKQRAFNDQEYISSNTNFIRVPAGTYTFQLQNQDSSIAASKLYNLNGGHIFTLFATGFAGNNTTQGISLAQIQNF